MCNDCPLQRQVHRQSGDYDELAPIHKSLSEKDLTVELNPDLCLDGLSPSPR